MKIMIMVRLKLKPEYIDKFVGVSKLSAPKKLCLKCDEEVLEICQKVSVDELAE